MAELNTLSLSELRSLLEQKKISSMELVNYFLQKIEQGKKLNAFLEVCADQARAQAKLADQAIAQGKAGSLLGIPLAIKDSIVTKDIRTTCASRILDNFIPPYDATVISRLKAAGAIVIGKTNLDEFCMGSSTENSAFGPTKNPWGHKRRIGGRRGRRDDHSRFRL
jgi:aspartyl-tRNA(Asn)/glutamyl-tRNA(Gln) amidotransferase subunit A